MTMWVVTGGEAFAITEADALRQAAAFDARQHPAQVEMELAAAAYRAGERWLQSADVTA